MAATAVREQLEREAAEVLAARIAEGRPPEAVWAAAARRAQRRQTSAGWYTSPEPSGTDPLHAPLVLRVVRLRVPPAAAALR